MKSHEYLYKFLQLFDTDTEIEIHILFDTDTEIEISVALVFLVFNILRVVHIVKLARHNFVVRV